MGMRKFGSAALPFSKVAYVVKGFLIYLNNKNKYIKFLGFIITPKGIIIDLTYIKAIKEQPKLKSYKNI